MIVLASDPAVVPELVNLLLENHCTVLHLNGELLAVGIAKSLSKGAHPEKLDSYLIPRNAARPAALAPRVLAG